MKKVLLVLLAAMLMVVSSGCIQIIIGPTNGTEALSAEPTAEEESKETQSETEEESTEPDSANVPDMFDPSGFYGVWAAADKEGSRLVFRPEFTVRYFELDSDVEKRILGFEGTGVPFNEFNQNGTLGFTLNFPEFSELSDARITLDGETLVLTKGTLEKRFAKSEKSEDTIRFIAEEKADILNGVLRILDEDGMYHTSQVQTKEDGIQYGTAWCTKAKVENGLIYIEGYIGTYDSDWNETVYGNGLVKLPVAEDLKIYASGGEAEDVLISVESFNESFYDTFTGLGIVLNVKNGTVIELYRQS